jgi:maltose phosphorylase
MAKVADSYFTVHPWQVIEEGFDPAYAMVSESVFSLGNEYMGVRGYMEEGYTGDSLQGSYFNGVYERGKAEGQGYKGIIREMEFMVNALDWLYLSLEAEGEQLDLAKIHFRDFRRVLDLQTGLLTREFIWMTEKGELQIRLERLVSMTHMERGAQRLTVTSLGFEGELKLSPGLNINTVHGSKKKKYWKCTEQEQGDHTCRIKAHTIHTHMEIEAICKIKGSITQMAKAEPLSAKNDPRQEENKSCLVYQCVVNKGESLTLEKLVHVITPLAQTGTSVSEIMEALNKEDFDQNFEDNACWWSDVWEKSDIHIEGDGENQQGIRFCIFQMFQTYHGAASGTNIGAKGLTGEAYNGNAFWDTETYCLPFYLFHNKEAARNLLYFRYATLEEAKKRAKDLDCKGAFYPVATISGRECCSLWQHASLQLQASTAVAFGIWIYETVLADYSFTDQYGFMMLIEISRMLASRGEYLDGQYGYYGVMGPDEFQMMVNNNCYTNYMAKFTLEYTVQTASRMHRECPTAYAEAVKKTNLLPEELVDFKQKARDMIIPYDAGSKLYEQHQGFFKLPHVEVDDIPIEDFPLYSHWSYDRIYRNDMIKQPDVLMFMLLFNSRFDQETIAANYDFYEPKCIHESSLSPSVHSILATQLGKDEEAFSFFRFATRMDMDNYNRNSGEGLHTTSIAAAWMNIVYGFGGLRCDKEVLSVAPVIPKEWRSYQFRIVYRKAVILVAVDQKQVRIRTLTGHSVTIGVYGQEITITGEEQVFVGRSVGDE